MAEEIAIAGIVIPANVSFVSPVFVQFVKDKMNARQESLTDIHEVLKKGLDELLGLQEDKEREVSSNYDQKDPYKFYEIWKKYVSKIQAEVTCLNIEYDRVKEKKRFLWINPQSKVEKEIKTALKEVIKLLDHCPKNVLIDKLTDPVIKEINVPQIVEYPTLNDALQEILTLLQSKGVKCVALYGQKGVGKTTIMQHLNNHFLDRTDFDMVIFIKVAADEQTKDLHILQKIAKRINVDGEGNELEVSGRIRRMLKDKRYLLILDGVWNTIDGIWKNLDISKDTEDGKVILATHYPLAWKSACVQRHVELNKLSPREAWQMFQDIVGDNLLLGIPNAQLACERFCFCLPLFIDPIARSFKNEAPTSWASSSKSTDAIGEPDLGPDLFRLMRTRDFLHLILSYPMRIGYEDILEQWINDASQIGLRRGLKDILYDESPLRYLQAVIPQDIATEIISGGRANKEKPLKQVPQPIILLATHLALHQLTLTLTSDTIPYSGRELERIQNIRFSARNDAEKRTVVENIQANSQIRATFGDLTIIDLNQIDDQTQREQELLNLNTSLEHTTSAKSPAKDDYALVENNYKSRHLVLAVDGDDDKNLNPQKVSLLINRDSKKVVVFITALSSAWQNDYFPIKVDLTINTEDHTLPWELFYKIVGSELLHSSIAIEEIAVQIVEKCWGHLLAIILMAQSLKHVSDVQTWELALQKLCYRGRETIVNAFLFNIIWPNVDSEAKKFRLLRCLMIFKFLDWKMTSDDELFDLWFYEQLVDTKEEAKSILQNFMECSLLLQFEDNLGRHNIQLPEDIKIILHALGEEMPENLSEGALESTISDLQVLNLSNTHMRNLYAVNAQPHVKELNLEGCMVETLPEAIFKLHKIETLSLEHCSQLLELPPQIAKLENLRELRLAGCERLEALPLEICELQKLETLSLEHCLQLLELPPNIAKLENLKKLTLAGCKRLQKLPQEIFELVNLRTLSLPSTIIFSASESLEFINSNEHSGRGKKVILSSSSAIIPIGFTLKLEAHGRFEQFEKFGQYIMKFRIQNLEQCDLSGSHITNLPPSLNFPNLRSSGSTFTSSKPTRVDWDKLEAQVKKGGLGPDLFRLMRTRDFLHLILSYPMRIGYEDILEQWINDASQIGSRRGLKDILYDESPLRYLQAVIPQDIATEIINGGRVSREKPLKQVPQPIILLATHLALHQLTLTLTSATTPYSRRALEKIQYIRFSTRNDAEKRTVLENIRANSQIRAKFGDLEIIDLNQIDDQTQREKALLNLATRRRNRLVLVVDGDGDKKLDPQKLILPINRDSKNIVVFITALSSAWQNDYFSINVDLTVKTEDHSLPWELFSKIVGSELLHSSIAIQEIAVQIVEKCGGHLLAIILMAQSLKHVTDVQTWELALEKLRFRGREAIVNAFLFIWPNVNAEAKKFRLLRCLMTFKFLDWRMTSDDELFDLWFSEQLVDTKEEAKSILQNFMECSLLLQFEDTPGQHNIQLPEDIKIILRTLGEEMPENLSEEELESTISDPQVLNLSNTHMRNLHAVYTQPHVKELNLEGCMEKTLPEAIFKLQLQKLETLSLEHCSQLLELPPQIAKLENLIELRLSGCKRLETPPKKIWELPNLEECDLSGAHITDLPRSLNFPNLRSLLLGTNLNLMKISPSFFDGVPLLTILDLSRTSIHELPSSIFNLQQLRELYLKDCELFAELSPEIQRLSNLVTLDLDGTLITHLPKEIEELTKMESLSLSFHNDDSSCAVIPLGVLSRLTKLKALKTDVNSDNEWWSEHVDFILKEIKGLKLLQELDMYIPRDSFSNPIDEKPLSNFRFTIGDHKPRMISRIPPAIEAMFKESSRSLKFVNSTDFPEEVKTVLSEAWAFFLDRHMTIRRLTNFGWENLGQLRLCILAECNEMRRIVPVDDKSLCIQFLIIFYLKNLISIIHTPTCNGSTFRQLKLLALHTCPELTTIFTMDSVRNLVSLEELIVEDCPKVSCIISCSSSKPTTDFYLPRLRKLSLLFVPELASISNGVRIGGNLEQMGLYYCPKLQSFSTAELSSKQLKVIRGETEWWGNLKWSEAEWGQKDRPHQFNNIFSPIDEDLDILNQLTKYEPMTSFYKIKDSGELAGIFQ